VLLQSALARDPSYDAYGRPLSAVPDSSGAVGYSSGSASIKARIEELCLDIPFAEKMRLEARAEQRASKKAEREERRRARAERRADVAATTGEETKEQLAPLASSDESDFSSGSEDDDEDSIDDALENGASDDDEFLANGDDPYVASAGAAAAAAASSAARPAARTSSSASRSTRAGSLLSPPPSSSVSVSGGEQGLAAPAPGKCMDPALYVDDEVDPFASLSKVFILLRIDAKYLWRFEEQGVHLGNMFLRAPSAEALRAVLPPLGPRLTLMNFMRERVEMQRKQAGLPPVNAPKAGAAGSASSSPEAQRRSLSGSYASMGSGLDSLIHRPLPPSEQEAATMALAARIQHGTPRPPTKPRPGSPVRRSAFTVTPAAIAASSGALPMPHAASSDHASASFAHLPSPTSARGTGSGSEQWSLFSPSSSASAPAYSGSSSAFAFPPPLNPINVPERAVLPVSPHNGVPIHRPLSARDRRTLYDARTHARSAMLPIRTFGVVNWK